MEAAVVAEAAEVATAKPCRAEFLYHASERVRESARSLVVAS